MTVFSERFDSIGIMNKNIPPAEPAIDTPGTNKHTNKTKNIEILVIKLPCIE